ncbi:hypothetical protein L1887_16985 [Cichorium endivia]|nr:hypothetical protein L1887_16985 [Cichorium endivia]
MVNWSCRANEEVRISGAWWYNLITWCSEPYQVIVARGYSEATIPPSLHPIPCHCRVHAVHFTLMTSESMAVSMPSIA